MSPQTIPNAQSRYCIQRIELKSTKKVNHKVSGRLLIDGEVVHKLPPIEEGQALVWDRALFCDAGPNSIFRLHVYEESYLGLIRTAKHQYEFLASEIRSNRSNQLIERASGTLSLVLSFSNPEAALSGVVAAAQSIEAPKAMLDRLGQLRPAVRTILDFGMTVSEISPLAEAALSILQTAWEKLEEQAKCDEAIEQLLVGFADTLRSVRPVKELAHSEDLKRTITEIIRLIQGASEFIHDYKSKSEMERLGIALVLSPQDKVQEVLEQLKRLKENFELELNVQRHLDRMDEELSKLKPATRCTFHHRRPCLEGTRTAIISDIDKWIQKDSGTDRFLWVHGLAGLGKSSIATSICQLLEDRYMLAASFFCKRDNPELRDPQRAMSTIIYHLARHYSDYRKLVVSAIYNDPRLCDHPVRLQYNDLVKTPLMTLADSGTSPTSAFVVVVDALDECGTTENRGELLACLVDMSRLAPWLKVIVTSRPDQDITEVVDQTPEGHLRQMNVREYDASNDIYVFLQERMGAKRGNRKFEESTINLLRERAAGLFIWAETACRFILNGFDPQARLQEVLGTSAVGDATAQLDALYATAIKSSMIDTSGDNLKILKKCIGIVIATGARTALSVHILEVLLGHDVNERIHPGVLDRVVKALGSVLYEDHSNEGQGAVRVYHPSFTDYITTPLRSGELCVDLAEQNVTLSTCCLNIMLKGLKFNICGLETSHRLNKDVPDLASRISSAIGPHLSYSCQYWISHVAAADPNRVAIHLLREHLFGRSLFYWIEALGLLRKLDVAVSALPTLLQWKHIPEDCSKCVNDAYRFILTFYDAISGSTPHLYLSALPFAPTQSEIAQRGIKWFPNTLKLTVGAEKHWTACLRTIAHPGPVRCFAVSPDGRRIVSGTVDDYRLRLWDTETGIEVSEPLVGHSGGVFAVAFSPDGRHIASGSKDKTVRVWNAQTGGDASEPFTKHTDAVNLVAFSPDSRRIISGSIDSDKTIRIWDPQTGTELFQTLVQDSPWISSVAFSSDKRRITAVFGDKIMRVWDIETRTLVSETSINIGNFDHVYSAAFSPDGRRMVLGYHTELQIRDLQTGSETSKLYANHSGGETMHMCTSVAFSPDGRRIAAGFNDYTVQIWDSETSFPFASLVQVGHSDTLRSIQVAFSPDGRRIISGSFDHTIRIWDIENRVESSGSRTRARDGPVQAVVSLAFSPDGRRVVSASGLPERYKLDIWDTGAGVRLTPSGLDGLNLDQVRSLAFSPDGQSIISTSYVEAPQMWDVETGSKVSAPDVGHSSSPPPISLRSSHGTGYIVSDSNNNSKLVEYWDPNRTEPLDLDSMVNTVLSPDERRVVSLSKSNTLQVWDVETGASASGQLVGHSDKVVCAAFSPDGRRIVSGSYDHTVRIWDIETSAEVREPFIGHSSIVASVAFSPDGHRIASGAYDNTLRIWNLEPIFTSELPANLSRLSQLIDSNGWVSLGDSPCLLWIPTEYRRSRIDDSVLCISSEASLPSPVIIDFSRFVHGTSWTSVVAA